MGTDRRVGAASRTVTGQHFFIQLHAHAVQALEFKATFAGCASGISCAFKDRRNGVRVVGGELAKKCFGPRQHFCGTGEISHVGVRLSREHRIAAEPLHLRTLDFGVPVGALYQARHHAPAVLRR